jgi:hypothetical protein
MEGRGWSDTSVNASVGVFLDETNTDMDRHEHGRCPSVMWRTPELVALLQHYPEELDLDSNGGFQSFLSAATLPAPEQIQNSPRKIDTHTYPDTEIERNIDRQANTGTWKDT